MSQLYVFRLEEYDEGALGLCPLCLFRRFSEQVVHFSKLF